MNTFLKTSLILTVIGLGIPACAPSGGSEPETKITTAVTMTDVPKAAAEDVASVDAIMAAVYDVISGPAGPRDWDRFRSLFHAEARLSTFRDNGPVVMTVEDYINMAGPLFNETPFFETELSRKTERYGGVVHAFSTYDSRRAPELEPFARGINSFQLVWADGRWWVLTILWQAESEDLPIPQKYLE